MIVIVYGGCWRCHSPQPLRHRVQTPTLRATECTNRAACDRRRRERDRERHAADWAEQIVSAAVARELARWVW